MSQVTIEVARTVAAVEALGADWDRLASTYRTPLLEHDWYACCASTLHDELDLRVVVVRERGEVTGIAPMVMDRSEGRRLVLLGGSILHEPSGWIFRSAGALGALGAAVAQLGERVVLHRVPRESALAALPRLMRGRAVAVVRTATASNAVVAAGSPNAGARLSSSRLRQFRVSRTRAEQAFGEVTVSRLAPGPRDVDGLLDLVVRVEGSGWKGANGSSLGSKGRLLAFFRQYCRRAAARGTLRISTLHFGPAVAAVELCIEAHGRLWELKIGYDERFSAYGPGLLLVDASIRDALARGLDGYEFLGAAEAWQERWHPEHRQFALVVMYPLSARASLGAFSDVMSFLSRRVSAAFRAGSPPITS